MGGAMMRKYKSIPGIGGLVVGFFKKGDHITAKHCEVVTHLMNQAQGPW